MREIALMQQNSHLTFKLMNDGPGCAKLLATPESKEGLYGQQNYGA